MPREKRNGQSSGAMEWGWLVFDTCASALTYSCATRDSMHALRQEGTFHSGNGRNVQEGSQSEHSRRPYSGKWHSR